MSSVHLRNMVKRFGTSNGVHLAALAIPRGPSERISTILITRAQTGAIHRPTMSPHMPVTAAEIVAPRVLYDRLGFRPVTGQTRLTLEGARFAALRGQR